LAALATPAGAQTALTAQEARAIAVDAYLYFYPLISMDVTRKQFTNVEPGKEFGRGPMNTFQSMPAYPAATDKGVVRYNFDTLYSAAPPGSRRRSALRVALTETTREFSALIKAEIPKWAKVIREAGIKPLE
jgi:hypothetical protein